LTSCFSFSATNNPGKGVPARLRKNDDRHGTSYLTPEKTFSILCNTEKPKMATGQTEKFSVHSKHHRAACSDKNGRKKKQQIFFKAYCFRCCRWAAVIQLSFPGSKLVAHA